MIVLRLRAVKSQDRGFIEPDFETSKCRAQNQWMDFTDATSIINTVDGPQGTAPTSTLTVIFDGSIYWLFVCHGS